MPETITILSDDDSGPSQQAERPASRAFRLTSSPQGQRAPIARPATQRPATSKSAAKGKGAASYLDDSDSSDLASARRPSKASAAAKGKGKARDDDTDAGPSRRNAYGGAAARRADDASSSPARTVSAPAALSAAPKRKAGAAAKGGLSSDTSDDDALATLRAGVLGAGAGAGKAPKRARTAGDGPSAKSLGKRKAAPASPDKSQKQLEREAKQAERARHMEEKKAWQEANKLRTSKADTSKELRIELDAGLFAAGGPLAQVREQLIAEIEKDGATTTVKERTHGSVARAMDAQAASLAGLHLIRILRRRTARLDPVRRSFVPLPRGEAVTEDEKTVIVCVACDRLLELVEDGSLLATMRAFRQALGLLFHQVVLVVQGLDAHFRKARNKSNRAYTEAVRQQVHAGAAQPAQPSRARRGADDSTVTREQMDRELMRLRVAERCFVVQVERAGELVQWIVSMIRDVGIRPYKLIRNSHLSFAVDAKTTSATTDEGVFSAMLQNIPRMTEPQADSIVYTFASFRNLMDSIHGRATDGTRKACDAGGTHAAALREIADCTVTTTKEGRLRKTGVRVGDALAQRLVALLSSSDPLALMG